MKVIQDSPFGFEEKKLGDGSKKYHHKCLQHKGRRADDLLGFSYLETIRNFSFNFDSDE